MGKTSILTLNTWKCDGDYRHRLDDMASGLKALAPEIVLLQEVFRTGNEGEDTGRFLAEALDMCLVFHPARRKPRSFEGSSIMSDSGLAVLSNNPIVEHGAFRLPGDERDGDRCAQWCVIDSGFPLLVINTHLTHLDGRDDLRREQLQRIIDFAASKQSADVTVIGGDFNCTPGSGPLRWLAEQAQVRLGSAWDEAGQGSYPSTLNPPEMPACIDHLYLADGRRPCRWESVAVLMTAADEHGVYPSDHAAVMGVLCC